MEEKDQEEEEEEEEREEEEGEGEKRYTQPHTDIKCASVFYCTLFTAVLLTKRHQWCVHVEYLHTSYNNTSQH